MDLIILFILIGVNVFVSMKGFSDMSFYERFLFSSYAVKHRNDYIRFISSGFLHVNWLHLGINMYVLYSFGQFVLVTGGWLVFLIIYFGSMIFGDILAYIVHKNSSDDYRAVGASGAVNGIIYACIIMYPDESVRFFGLSPEFPLWLYGIGYLAYSVFGMTKRFDNVGHEAHLGGAIAGLLITVGFYPQLVFSADSRTQLIAGLLLFVSLGILLVIIFQPQVLGLAPRHTITRSEEYSLVNEWNYLADKANRLGEHALTERERQRMKEIDKKLKRRFF